MTESETLLAPEGELTMKFPATEQDTNIFGDVYGGWVSSMIVAAAEVRAAHIAGGRVATVSIGAIDFLSPVLVGTLLSFYTRIKDTGHSSITIMVEAWGADTDGSGFRKITEAETVQVAIDSQGRIRQLPTQ